jgi:hypothetical protein
MNSNPDTGMQINAASLLEIIGACETAQSGIFQILHDLRLHGQSGQEWADDAVSHDVAGHYTEQLWAGAHCTYSALNNYYDELGSTVDTLRQILASYNSFDGATAASLEQL